VFASGVIDEGPRLAGAVLSTAGLVSPWRPVLVWNLGGAGGGWVLTHCWALRNQARAPPVPLFPCLCGVGGGSGGGAGCSVPPSFVPGRLAGCGGWWVGCLRSG
jgi:hypothetical protein